VIAVPLGVSSVRAVRLCMMNRLRLAPMDYAVMSLVEKLAQAAARKTTT
jgi:hypothetical protein